MTTRIRTINFLPDVFKTPTNKQFLGATLDQIVDQPNTMTIEGYVGSKFGYGVNAKNKYVIEPTKNRIDYQLEPGVVFTKKDSQLAQDFISYPGIIDALKIEGADTTNNDRLFSSEFYSWDPFVNLDMLINFNQYYWLELGPPAVNVSGDINVLTDILGKANYTSPNGVVFTNGLKVIFTGLIFPETYATGEYYVQGVGTSIELVNVLSLVAPEPFTTGKYNPYDISSYSTLNYDQQLYVPTIQDYITIARNSVDKNAWSRSNRWFHIDVIKATAEYNNDPTIVTALATAENKAKRPIIEFYPNLKLFNSGALGTQPVDFIDFRTTDAYAQVAGQQNYYPDVEVYTGYTATIAGVTAQNSTTITISPVTSVQGVFQVGQFINDVGSFAGYQQVLPNNTTITGIVTTSTEITLTVEWGSPKTFATVSNVSVVANDFQNSNFSLFPGAKVIFANDPNYKGKILVSQFSVITPGSAPVITLTEAIDGTILPDYQTVAFRGYNNQGKDFRYTDELTWVECQQKTNVNQPPKFDIFDKDGISFGNSNIYIGTSFKGTTLFQYGRGSGLVDAILGFPVRYSSFSNLGDISFDVTFNSDTFTFIKNSLPQELNVNTGYVYNYNSLGIRTRQLGWQTAVAPSRQYQIFSFDYKIENPQLSFVCDIAAEQDSVWPAVQVYVNNVLYTEPVTIFIGTDTTTVTFQDFPAVEDTVIQITILSTQVSKTAYYEVPINLSNNPLNQNLTECNIGDIRGQYQSIFYNNPYTMGQIFGANNYRDLGNMVPWGNKIIQNSASLVLPGAFLRKQNNNLISAIQYNSEQYIVYKNLLIDVINNTDFSMYYSPAVLLDDAIEQITASKSESGAFFWSDMLPSKAIYASNSYTFANSLDTSTFPLTKIYDFSKANYSGVLVYLTRQNKVTQLIKGLDYTVSSTSPSLTVTLDLLPNDVITINEYNQTFGSYVPNTPTKLGLYPAFIPEVILDPNYTYPTYFIRGHDGSYNKLYGNYVDGNLDDFRDQVLLEFETRIYNNLKLEGATLPINEYDIIPGFFRETDYSYEQILEIYSQYFLNWVGQNRIDFKPQLFNTGNEYSYNYSQSGNKLTQEAFLQGYWRGIYQYFYDTTTPNTTPWEMLFLTSQPAWWQDRYGPAPYTSDNLVLWGDLAAGINWNNGDPYVIPQAVRPDLLKIIPVDSEGNLTPPFVSVMGNYDINGFRGNWKVGDVGPAEFSYRRSSSWPFDLMKIYALTKPAQFFNLGVDIDNYRYNAEFNQYLFNDRSHLIIDEIQIYGNGTAKTSYINWVVDYEKQVGIDATTNITSLLYNLDVRLVYRLAGFSDKTLLKFFVEKGTPNSRNASLLIPDESYAVLLYDNQPYDKIIYSSVIIQKTQNGWKIFGNSQQTAYFTVSVPKINGNFETIQVEQLSVQIANDYFDDRTLKVPYGQEFYTAQELGQFLASYGHRLQVQGVQFNQIESGLDVNWAQMVAEFLYWAQSGWDIGSLINLNPAANVIEFNKDSLIVQPLTIQRQNFILNQNLYPIQIVDLAIERDGTSFKAAPLNEGDTVAYTQFNVSNFEHGIVFDNETLFNDVIYNLVTGLKQNRIFVRGYKTAEWNGTIDAQGFILNQDNVQEWNSTVKYTKGQIVKYKNKFWVALTIVQPKEKFDDTEWKETDYNEIQKGLLPNSSTRSYESTLYYDSNKANLEQDASLLGFSLIGYRPRDYLALADLTDITQVNVYKNLIKQKGTRTAVNLFKGAQLPQGGIDYNVYENWAIKSSEFGGVLNQNFVDFRLNESLLTGNPSLVGFTNGLGLNGIQQDIPIYSIINYGRPITSPNILPSISENVPNITFPDAGYVNFNDIKAHSYYYPNLNFADTPISKLYVGEYIWVADYLSTWQVYTPISIGQVVSVTNNLNGTVTLEFNKPHNLTRYQPIAVISFNSEVDGYYVVNSIVDLTKVVITLSLSPSVLTLTGRGVGVKFVSTRVATPSDILNLPLFDTEFTKNKVWVDQNANGTWGVLRKDINYELDKEFIDQNAETFGSAVAFTNELGYLISDAGLGNVYRYEFNPVNQQYIISQTITGTEGFGSVIKHEKDIFVIGNPTGNDGVQIFKLVINQLQNELVLTQVISNPNGVSNWGQGIALSGNLDWLFISACDKNSVYVYRKSQVTNLYEFSSVISLGTSQLDDNFGFSISTDFYGKTLVVSSPNYNYSATIDNWGTTYVFDRLEQSFETSEFPIYSLVVSNNANVIGVSQSYSSNNRFVCSSTSTLEFAMPVVFTGAIFGNVQPNVTYYVNEIVSPTEFSISDELVTANSFSTGLSGEIIVDNPNNFIVGNPVIFYGNAGDSNIQTNFEYTISNVDIANSAISITGNIDPIGLDVPVYLSVVSTGNSISLFDEPLGSMSCYPQDNPLYVSNNGVLLTQADYSVTGTTLTVYSFANVGDIVSVGSAEFVLVQELTTQSTPEIGVQFGYSVDTNTYGTEILVGAPFEVNENNLEGAVYRFTNAGAKYGSITGDTACNLLSSATILLNGYAVTIPAGDATVISQAINNANITNITSSALNGILTISVINVNLALAYDKLSLAVTDKSVLEQLGINIFTQTQVIKDIHPQFRTQFGTNVKFNEFDSFVVSAPVAARYTATTFDFSQDENYDNDTLFDNNTTQWIDSFQNAGAVYMYDYVSEYNESITNTGKFVYSQAINAKNIDYGQQPYYGTALDFSDNRVVIGTPQFKTGVDNGQVISYNNTKGIKNWTTYRFPASTVDTSKIQNTQLYSLETNKTLVNLDYIDPLQGKILGVVRENLDYVSNVDPACYNAPNSTTAGATIWGAEHIGKLWFNTSTTKFVNYHQNDSIQYNSKWWGRVFPGSNVTVYSWISSDVPPINYQGLGTPYDINSYSIQYKQSTTGALVPLYFYWVRNTNLIFSKLGKTLSDTICESYISSPQSTGIAYMAPLQPNAIALYNTNEYVNANDTVMHLGFATGNNTDVAHSQFNLIRAGYPSDFLPGLPGEDNNIVPVSLYDRLLDSLSGVDEAGGVVPNPYLPKPVQSGIYVRPRQSFFYNRFAALKNYLGYANNVLIKLPIAETNTFSFLFSKNPEETGGIVQASAIRKGYKYKIVSLGNTDFTTLGAPSNTIGLTFLATGNSLTSAGHIINPAAGTGTAQWIIFEEGEKYDTTQYWNYVYWWAEGYNNNTRSALIVPTYADLATINAQLGLIVTVARNGAGNQEVYRYQTVDGNYQWVRIGLQNGTIQFNLSLWDYPEAKLGFGDNFFDVQQDPFDNYPSEPTRNIIRALNEQIYVEELLEFRNKSLILLFEYIQSETIENQNYLPWLNKTSFIDVDHTIRELLPLQVFQSDNQDFLAGYINEAKPYHVVIKDFVFKYTGTDVWVNNVTDFDLPATYNSNIDQYITPVVEYESVGADNQYLYTDDIWQAAPYKNWYDNYGVKVGIPANNTLVGKLDYQISTLRSYLARNTTEMFVDNVNGFPVTGKVKLTYFNTTTKTVDYEIIGYNGVDLANNRLYGLIRGLDETSAAIHFPGETIFMDLPPVIVLNGGRGYDFIPEVTVSIDTEMFPEPREPAVLKAIVNQGKIIAIDTISTGLGYYGQPKVNIEPAFSVQFSSASIDPALNVIGIQSAQLQTGDLVIYSVGANTTKPAGLLLDEYYYVNVLQSVPYDVVALYTSYNDAINDRDRVVLGNTGTGSNHYLALTAKATLVVNAQPVRENNVTLRFDRTSYRSKIQNWESGKFYGSFYAGVYTNSSQISSSAFTLATSQPNVANFLASAQGAILEIQNIVPSSNTTTITWNSLPRLVSSTSSSNNVMTIASTANGAATSNSVGPTTGFYVDMPIRFTGNTIGGLSANTTYYVASIPSLTEITLTNSVGGGQISLTNDTANVANSQVVMELGKVTDIGIIDINYPGILNVTTTQQGTNVLTVPLTPTGLAGTTNMYQGVPVFFTGNVFGNIIENEIYYVTSILNNQQFTISKSNTPLVLDVVSASTIDNTLSIKVGQSTNQVSVGDPLVFQNVEIEVGNLLIGQEYTIQVIGGTDFTEFGASTNSVGTTFTATGTGIVVSTNLVANLSYTIVDSGTTDWLSVGATSNLPGTTFIATGSTSGTGTAIQGNGVVTSSTFAGLNTNTFYYVSTIANNSSFTVSPVLNGNVQILTSDFVGGVKAIDQSNTKNLTNANGNMTMYVGAPLSPGQINGQLFNFYSTSGNVYTNVVGTESELINRTVRNTVDLGTESALIISNSSGSLNYLYSGMDFEVSANVGGLTTGNVYTITGFGNVQINNITSASANALICANTVMLYTGMPVVFTGVPVGGLSSGMQYFVTDITPNTSFKLATTQQQAENPAGDRIAISNNSGTMTLFGESYITISDSVTNSATAYELIQSEVSQTPQAKFNVSYILGGYNVSIAEPSVNFAVNNRIIISGADVGGVAGTNDVTIVVDEIGENGEITNISVSGLPASNTNQFYLKVISANSCAVYADAAMTIPVPASQIETLYSGIIQTAATATNGTAVTVSDTTNFNVNDPVVFTGYLGNAFGGIEVGKQYFVQSVINGNTLRISADIDGSPISFATSTGNYIMAKVGSFIFLPEPFYFDSSIVAYNNRVYRCIISNNDDTFNLGKWELVQSDSRSLNALDRIEGYYQPTINMPGKTLPQLVANITYPNSTYLDNPFAPEDQFNYDTELSDLVFSPTGVNNIAITNSGNFFVGISNQENYSGIIKSISGSTWSLSKISEQPIALTDIIYSGDKFVVSTENTAVPIIASTNAVDWYAIGQYTANTSIEPQPVTGLAYSSNVYVAVTGTGNILVSSTGNVWNNVYSSNVTSFVGVSNVATSSFDGFVALGETSGNATVLTTTNATSWTNTAPVTSNMLMDVTSGNDLIVAVGENAAIYYSSDAQNWVAAASTAGVTANLFGVTYGNGLFIAVGETGNILISSDGDVWANASVSISANLNDVIFDESTGKYIIAGDDNTILQSTTGNNWQIITQFIPPATVYDVQGDEFLSGYGPEELVSGVVSDNLTMIVNTRPGTTWDAEVYQNVGYNINTIFVSPTIANQTAFSFAGAVQNPINLAVFLIDLSTGLGVRVTDYSVDWVKKLVILNAPISSAYQLQIDVYEVGNGDQLVKSTSQNDPVNFNTSTGFNEIYLNCNYIADKSSGSGVVRPNTEPAQVEVTSSESVYNTLKCASVKGLQLNAPISFLGDVFGGVVAQAQYFVKTINAITNTITISDSAESGVAGPTFDLTDDTGSMQLVIKSGNGSVWTDPVVMHNGTLLTLGEISAISQTYSNGSIVCNSTSLFSIDEPIVFSTGFDAFGTSIIPNQVYYINNIIDDNEFTVSDTIGGSTVALVDAFGTAFCLTNDYAITIANNGISAKIVLSNKLFTTIYDSITAYNKAVDFISYVVFGETQPVQYGNTFPVTQAIEATGDSTYQLANYLGGDNPENAVVEVNGIRQLTTAYSIDFATQSITFTGNVASGTISVTTYNDTERQGFVTQTISNKQVSRIINVDNNITPALAITQCTSTSTGNIACVSTSGFVAGQTVTFAGTNFGSTLDGNVVYFVSSFSPTEFSIEYANGTPVTFSTESIAVTATVGARPTVRITTQGPNNFDENDLVRINGLQGSIQLNNNTYYVRIIKDDQFDIYNSLFDPNPAATNDPVLIVSPYAGGGYAWKDDNFIISSTWDQTNVNRLYVTVDGFRVPPTSLVLNENNNLSILLPISTSNVVMVTSMMPNATPNQMVYFQNVNKFGEASVYRGNSLTKTWLTQPLYGTDTTIYVNDASRVTNTIVKNVVTPQETNGDYYIGLNADKNSIVQVLVRNNSTGFVISPDQYSVVLVNTAPELKIIDGVSQGDNLTITIIVGNLIYINGEQIKFTRVDLLNNVLYGAVRGVNGTGVNRYLPTETILYGILADNKLDPDFYNQTWNSSVYNPVTGDPLQISVTAPAEFLNIDVT